MQFAEPKMFLFLWVAVVIALFLSWALKRKEELMNLFAGELTKEIASSFSLRRQIVKNVLLLGVFIFSIVALARPQWGFEWQEVKRHGLDIFVAMDTSKSMLTADVKPNRLEKTKLAVRDLIPKLKGDRIGLIAFAGDAFLSCPLTVDYGGFLLSLEDLNTQTIQRGGTNIASAIHEAIKAYEKISGPYRALIIITDGESLEGDVIAAAKQAKEKGIKIFCIGVGTQEGDLIRLQNDQGEYEFLKDNQGNFVKSRLNENLLQEIAQTTGGAYVRTSGAQFGLDLIYDQQLNKIERRDIESKMEKKYFERFQIPLAIAFLLLLTDSLLTTRKKI